MTAGRTLVLLLLAVLLVGCTEDPATPSSVPSPSAGTPSPRPSATPVAVPRAPGAASCYRLTPAELTRPSSSARPVPCSGRHTTRTIFVGRLDTVAGAPGAAVPHRP